MIKEFKAFISRGSVLDMAVGLILATYFGAIVKSFVSDILMPPIGNMLGGIDFKELMYVIQPAVMDAEGAVTQALVAIKWGMFVDHIITFLIVAFAIFMMIKGINKAKKKEEEAPVAPPEPSKEEVLLGEIRDLLKK